MHTDGETIYYRSDRPNRASARPEKISVPVHSDRLDRSSGEAQAIRLEQVADRLERSLTRLTEALKQVTEQYIDEAAAKAARLMRTEGANLRSTRTGSRPDSVGSAVDAVATSRSTGDQSSDADQFPGAGQIQGSTSPVGMQASESVKVSLFAEGNARAILGHVRIQHEAND